MNQHLQTIHDFIQQADAISAEDKTRLLKAVKDTNTALSITEFKLDRTEKVKRTTGILLEETIEELEQKRKIVEDKNRELEIETALERVRSRTMAMHRSEELADTASVLFKQIKELGFETWSCGFCIWKKNDLTEVWMAANSGGLLPPMLIPYKEEPTHRKIYEASLDGESQHENIWEGDELAKHYQFLRSIPSVNGAITILENSGLTLPAKQCYYVGFFNQGYLLLITTEPKHGAIELSKRFAAVFEQTYTRFLDLQKAEANALRAEQDLIEITNARKKAEDALIELRATQAQLIQSEKMASLGELTAGIAHEIQNPLNFVNNFAEVSKELLDEMREELKSGNIGDAQEIANDLIQNLEKINHHGKRADAIVKGMLQHSRRSSSQKEPVSINALADEYLRLAYHGLRAKDKSFNATLKTTYDQTISSIDIIPQDMGRAILNLITNAFYAVDEKKRSGAVDYEPTVSVSTKKVANAVEISVKDNGKGIPTAIADKIFQPFFTTKPTGQGTGLGLSLSYDIVVKGHGGTITLVSHEGEGSEFIIGLPLI